MTDFFSSWEVYRAVIDNDCMEHSLIYPLIGEILRERTEPFTVLDLGCGDAAGTGPAMVGTAAARKKQLARISGYFQIGLATIGLFEVLRRFLVETELPDSTSMAVLSALALAGNIATLVVLHRVRSGEAHLQASWIFTANDIKVNGLVIAAAIGVAVTDSAVPDLVAGGIIFVVVANGARRILKISR